MNKRMKMLRAVALEADAFYEQAKEFGVQAARALGCDKRSQITGLESIANSTPKVSDVLDYLKLRTARQKEWQQGDLGKHLIHYIETDLKEKRDAICRPAALCRQAELGKLDPFVQQEVYMLLIRAFVAQLAAQYEFACQQLGQANGRQRRDDD